MHFVKAIVSTVALTMPMSAVAAPSPNTDHGLEARVASLEARSQLEARQGWTCAFLGGDRGCQVKCFGLRGTGGFCNDENVCTCHSS